MIRYYMDTGWIQEPWLAQGQLSRTRYYLEGGIDQSAAPTKGEFILFGKIHEESNGWMDPRERTQIVWMHLVKQ